MSTITVNRRTSTTARTTAGTTAPSRRRQVARERIDRIEAHPRSSAAPVRLTRRGRWVRTLVLLGAVLALSIVFGSGSVATGDRGASPATTTVVVTEGASLWSIADEIAEPGETREVMYEIERLNELESSVLVPGQTLVVPSAR
jgi:LysM repeat protein